MVVRVAQEAGRTPAQVLLRWAIQRGHSVLPKSVKPYGRRAHASQTPTGTDDDAATRGRACARTYRDRIRANADLTFELSAEAMAQLNGISQARQHRYVDPRSFWNIDVFGTVSAL